MNNFGVIELASTKTASAPGWAYVPDTGAKSSVAALQPTNRKRAARSGQQGLSYSDQSARQEVKVRKELEALDREGGGREQIPVPTRKAQGKHTPNVRKILQSQKTFANHLDDYEAMQALQEQNPTTTNRSTTTTAPTKSSSSRRPAKPPPKPSKPSSKQTPTPAAGPPAADEDTPMTDAPQESTLVAPLARNPAEQHPGDSDALLVSAVPEAPSDAELRRLLEHPPLSYNQARAGWGDEEGRYPKREFCQVCGYWGRVRCGKCGARVCALGCLEVHREECVTRYGI